MHTGGLSVRDVVTNGQYRSLARYIIHPQVNFTFDVQNNSGCIVLPDGRSIFVKVSAGRAYLEESSYAPEFGKILSAQCLVVELENGESETRWSWSETLN